MQSGGVLVWLSVWTLERGADLHTAQLMPLPRHRKIQTGFTFLVPAHPGSPQKGAIKQVCVSECTDMQIHMHLNSNTDLLTGGSMYAEGLPSTIPQPT